MLKPIVSAAAALPITLAQVKAQSTVDFGDDDVLLDSYLKAAVAYLDGPSGVLNVALSPREVVQSMANFSCMRLPYGPVSAVTLVEYIDLDGVTQTLSGWRLLEDEEGAIVYFDGTHPAIKSAPDAVSITYTAGFSNGVPQSLLQAIAMLTSTWYEYRETVTLGSNASKKLPYGVDYLIAPYRRVGV